MTAEPAAVGDGPDPEAVAVPDPEATSASDDAANESAETVSPSAPTSSKRDRTKPSSARNMIEWVVVVVGALGVALLVNAFLLQPFRIPSSSMYPTLKDRDRVVVNKLSYDAHSVRRGDVVVFTRPTCKLPNDPVWAACADLERVRDLIKRVIGLPGDRVDIHDGHVFINGKQLSEPYLPQGVTTVQAVGCAFPMSYTVPKNDVFVMGDNRGDSLDGRCFGPVPINTIVGRAFVKIWPLSRLGWL